MMKLAEMRQVARFSPDGFAISWTREGWVLSKGFHAEGRLETDRGCVRYFKTVDAAVKVASGLQILDITLRLPAHGQLALAI